MPPLNEYDEVYSSNISSSSFEKLETSNSSFSTPLGFSNNLITYLNNCRNRLDDFVAEQKKIIDDSILNQSNIVEGEQKDIQKLLDRYKEIQKRRGVSSTNEGVEVIKDGECIANQKMALKMKQSEVEKDLTNLHVDHSRIKNSIEDAHKQEIIEKGKAEEVRKAKLRAEESKRISVDDLTVAVLHYKMLGLDFVKGENNSVRCNFNMIDPKDHNRQFSFLLNVNTFNDQYEVQQCKPPLKSSVLLQIVEELNATESLPIFIRSMRNAFKESLVKN